MQLLNKRLCVLYSLTLPSMFSQLGGGCFVFWGGWGVGNLFPFFVGTEIIFISPNETLYKINIFKNCILVVWRYI